jgi:hypothetical protein
MKILLITSIWPWSLKFNILSHSNNFNLEGDTVDLEIMVVVKVRVVVKIKASFVYAHTLWRDELHYLYILWHMHEWRLYMLQI